jgi:hypothetical protein
MLALPCPHQVKFHLHTKYSKSQSPIAMLPYQQPLQLNEESLRIFAHAIWCHDSLFEVEQELHYNHQGLECTIKYLDLSDYSKAMCILCPQLKQKKKLLV